MSDLDEALPLGPPLPVLVGEAAYQLCRLYDRDPPTPADLKRWSNMIRVWVDRYPDVRNHGTASRRRYLLPELFPHAAKWRARHGGRGPRRAG